jgi:hypothetical protein
VCIGPPLCLDCTSRPWIARQTSPGAKPPGFAGDALECGAIRVGE